MPDLKLKTCPFCGKDRAKIVVKDKVDGYVTYKSKKVECKSCGASSIERTCDGYYGLYYTDEEAASDWNRRVDDICVYNLAEYAKEHPEWFEKIKNMIYGNDKED